MVYFTNGEEDLAMLTKPSNQGPPLVGEHVGRAPFNDRKTGVRKTRFKVWERSHRLKHKNT